MAKVDTECKAVCESESHLFDFNDLPDLAMLKIFNYLDFSNLCKCARVCWRWYHLTKEHTFHKKISIFNGLRRPGQLPCLVKYHCTEHLEEFQLVRFHKSQMLMFPDTDMTGMLQRCTRLKKLVLSYCYLNYFSLSMLPPSVKHLSVRGCHVVPETFFAPSTLVCLDMSGVRQFLTSAEMPLLNQCKSLRALFLEGCDRINNAGIEAIADILPQLDVIDVEGTDISNTGAYTVIYFCKNARDIYLGSTNVDDGVFEFVRQGSLPFLRDFCVRGSQVTPEGLEKFMLTHLKSQVPEPRSKDYFYNCLDYNAAFHRMLKVYLGSSNGCNHYIDHPEYGRNPKPKKSYW